jgi:phage-related protein
MNYKFRVIFLDEVNDFLEKLDEKAKEKIIYNIWKARMEGATDKKNFKKLQDEIWEFRTLYNKTHYRLFAFWDKLDKTDTVVISTHGIIKKTDKIDEKEIVKAKKSRENYFNDKNKKQ